MPLPTSSLLGEVTADVHAAPAAVIARAAPSANSSFARAILRQWVDVGRWGWFRYAYRLGRCGDEFEFGDQRGVSAMSARPLFEALRERQLTDATIAVGGAVEPEGFEACQAAATLALDRAETFPLAEASPVIVRCPHEVVGGVRSLLVDRGARLLRVDYGARVEMTVTLGDAERPIVAAALRREYGDIIDLG